MLTTIEKPFLDVDVTVFRILSYGNAADGLRRIENTHVHNGNRSHDTSGRLVLVAGQRYVSFLIAGFDDRLFFVLVGNGFAIILFCFLIAGFVGRRG